MFPVPIGSNFSYFRAMWVKLLRPTVKTTPAAKMGNGRRLVMMMMSVLQIRKGGKAVENQTYVCIIHKDK